MDARRHQAFRKRPPARARAQRRRMASERWETVFEDEDRDDQDRDDQDWDVEREDDEPTVSTQVPAVIRMPAQRVPVHDQDPAPAVDDTAPRRTGRWVLISGTVAVTVAGLVAGALLLIDHGSTTSPAAPDLALIAFDPPTAVRPDTEYVRSRVLRSGEVRVHHWIRSSKALSRMTVRVPQVDGVDLARVSVRRLVVVADGRSQEVPHTLGGRQLVLRFRASTTLEVSYVLRGATRRSGSEGRALVRLTALGLSFTPRTSSRTAVLDGVPVLSVACSAPRTPSEPCGERRQGRWRVVLGADRRDQQVSAVVELPAAR